MPSETSVQTGHLGAPCLLSPFPKVSFMWLTQSFSRPSCCGQLRAASVSLTLENAMGSRGLHPSFLGPHQNGTALRTCRYGRWSIGSRGLTVPPCLPDQRLAYPRETLGVPQILHTSRAGLLLKGYESCVVPPPKVGSASFSSSAPPGALNLR